MCWLKPVVWLKAAALLLALASCSHNPQHQSQRLPLLPPASFGQQLQLNQSLQLQGEEQALQLALLIKPEQLRLTALSALGQRLFELGYDGAQLQQQWYWNELPIEAELVIGQLQAALWPVAQLRRHYPAPWRVQQLRCQRHVFYGQLPVLSMRYCHDQSASTADYKNIELSDHLRNTRMQISTHEQIRL